MFVGIATITIFLVIFAVMWQGVGYTAFNDMNRSISQDSALRAGVDIGQIIAMSMGLLLWVVIIFLAFVVLLMAFMKLKNVVRG